MFDALSRRRFVTSSLTAGALAGLGDFSFLGSLPALSAADAEVSPRTLQLSPDIEPLVRLIEETPREKVLEEVAGRIKKGTSYGDLLSATLLAGVRGIKPRPVGFQFHAVLVINSAHLASLAAADNDRWLPLFWAVDNFKASQATNKQKNAGWMMPPGDESKLPPAETAKKAFIDGMDNWDEDAADRAVVALYRSASAGEIIELFWRYGCRDFRDIGHKAIFVANSWRTLNTIGWRHAEPVLRSLVSALLDHEGDNPAKRDADPDVPGRENKERAAKIGELWQRSRKPSPEAAADLLHAMRTAGTPDACNQVVELLGKGVHPSSVWDGLFLTAGEYLMRQPGIVGLHCVTSINALHQAYVLTSSDETRRMTMLQGAAFLSMFRKFMITRGPALADRKIDLLEKADGKPNGDTLAEIFANVGRDKDNMLAAGKALALLAEHPAEAETLMKAARRLIFLKGRDSHDYKFSSAALEDYRHVSPAWRSQYLASSLFWLHGSGEADNGLVKRTRAALA
jgi:hypothetical protein